MFDPRMIDKEFIKVRRKNNEFIKVNDSLMGLFTYLFAPNIRYKVIYFYFYIFRLNTLYF